MFMNAQIYFAAIPFIERYFTEKFIEGKKSVRAFLTNPPIKLFAGFNVGAHACCAPEPRRILGAAGVRPRLNLLLIVQKNHKKTPASAGVLTSN